MCDQGPHSNEPQPVNSMPTMGKMRIFIPSYRFSCNCLSEIFLFGALAIFLYIGALLVIRYMLKRREGRHTYTAEPENVRVSPYRRPPRSHAIPIPNLKSYDADDEEEEQEVRRYTSVASNRGPPVVNLFAKDNDDDAKSSSSELQFVDEFPPVSLNHSRLKC